MARVCIFCGERAGNREHFWPDWLNEVLPDYTDTTYTLGSKSWQSKKPATHKIGAVCKPCNTGWMAALEKVAGPILTPLILGRKRRMSLEDQRVIAAWAFKMAVLGEHFSSATAVISEEARHYLREHGEAPPDVSVVIGATDARWPGDTHYSDKKLALHSSPYVASQGRVGNAATVLIKHLALQVGWSPIENTVFGYQPPFIASLARIWPRGVKVVEWPPGPILGSPATGHLIDFWRGDAPPKPPW